jgi:hypothetical protein
MLKCILKSHNCPQEFTRIKRKLEQSGLGELRLHCTYVGARALSPLLAVSDEINTALSETIGPGTLYYTSMLRRAFHIRTFVFLAAIDSHRARHHSIPLQSLIRRQATTLSQNLPGGWRKPRKAPIRVASEPVTIRSGRIPHTSQKR